MRDHCAIAGVAEHALQQLALELIVVHDQDQRRRLFGQFAELSRRVELRLDILLQAADPFGQRNDLLLGVIDAHLNFPNHVVPLSRVAWGVLTQAAGDAVEVEVEELGLAEGKVEGRGRQGAGGGRQGRGGQG